jgi:hypothetical protein
MVRLDLLDVFCDALETVDLEHSVPVLGDAMLKRGKPEGMVGIKALEGSADVVLRKREVVMQGQRQRVGR